ncbi:MAG TPA: VOC family protein [Novosphingobium sp.]|nr:VOC family protein [Novosphingobium sp.]
MVTIARGHYQNAYVTHDLDRAMQRAGDLLGIAEFIVFEPDMVLETPQGRREASVRAALGWSAGLQVELIEPVSGYVDHYLPFLPPDRRDPSPRFHHVGVRRDDIGAMRAEIARTGLPLAFEGSVPGLTFVYLDARETLGHYFEYVWASAEGWAGQGWPPDRPIS